MKLTLSGGVPHHASLVALWRDDRLFQDSTTRSGSERHSLWERHCQATDPQDAFKLRRLKRHKSWKQVWLQSRCHDCEDAHIGAPGWGVKLASGAKVRTGRRLVVPRPPSGARLGLACPGLSHMTHNLPYQGQPVRALRGGGHALRRGEPLQDALCQAAAAPRPHPWTRRARRRTRLRQHTWPEAGAHAGDEGTSQGGRGFQQRKVLVYFSTGGFILVSDYVRMEGH